MTARSPARKRTPPRTETPLEIGQNGSEQGKQPPNSDTKPAPTPAKLVRKGRKPSAGARLRRRYAQKGDPFVVELMIDQAVEHADRLEVLRRLLAGDADAWLAVRVAGQVVSVVVSDVVREERQQSELLRRLIMDIEKLRGGEGGGKGGEGGVKNDPVAAIVAQHYPKRTR